MLVERLAGLKLRAEHISEWMIVVRSSKGSKMADAHHANRHESFNVQPMSDKDPDVNQQESL